MSKQEFNPQSGKSLVELMIILIIVSILVTFSINQFSGARVHLQRQNITRAMKVYFERARFDSVKRHAHVASEMARVTLLSPTSYSVTLDLNHNGTIENSETKVIDFSGGSDARILATGLTFPTTIRFDERGRISATNSGGAEVTPLFTLCGTGCTLDNANAANASVISISPTGTVAVLAGGQSMPTFQNPSVTNVNSNLNVNPDVKVN